MKKVLCDAHRWMRKKRFHTTVHLSPGVLVRLRPSTHANMHKHTHQHTHIKQKTEPTALWTALWTASQVWDKVHSPPLGYQTVVQACIHLWKTWRLFSHTAQLSLYLQMVLLSRNVTFDLVPLTERASQWKVGEGFSGLPNRTNEHMIVCMAKIGLTQFKNLDKCPVLSVLMWGPFYWINGGRSGFFPSIQMHQLLHVVQRSVRKAVPIRS